MTSLLLAAALGGIYVYLRRKDPRMLRNGIVLVAAFWFGLLGVSRILADAFPWFDWAVLGFIALTPLAVVVLAGFLIANGVTMLRHESRGVGNLLSMVAGVALLALPVMAGLLLATRDPLAIGFAALLFFLCSYFGVVFVIFLAYAVAYGRMRYSISPDVVVILGSQVMGGKVPPLLRSRLDKGLEVYGKAPADVPPLLIPSGGRGPGESCSEGEAMAEYLLAQGVPQQDVAAETRAANTEQNLRFSAVVAATHGRRGPLLVVTSNYHVLRAALLSRKVGLDAQVVGSPTAHYFLPSAFLREYVAILVEHRKLHVVMCLPFVGITALLTVALLISSQ
ncbi:YdcF family protein [Arthrobacter sp. GMC3]|uniref:YdcF family protein n=1 Tax=Arthrobacter sp. GMC3 TaxID=2058894 RepID=UPI002157D702|nr:YdcF family protein [Arthrobacter sp. GMC3]